MRNLFGFSRLRQLLSYGLRRRFLRRLIPVRYPALLRDATGSVIPGVSILVKNEAQGQERQTITNEQGYYVFPNLPVGPYSVTAELAGFMKFVKTASR
jgi:hypothetical protein